MLGFGVIVGGYLKNEMTNYEMISHSFNGSRNATTLKFQHKLKILPAFSLCIFLVSHKNPTKIRLCQYPMKTRAKSYIFVF
ncbi:hypothetical protein B4917_07715 [Helicobacter pylori]|nr:hypothetical protein CEP79_05500 [Helicobacter pylori]OQU75155.1 hypothetical protein BW246_01360 [Helicobacter pylori]ORJ07627.1 hypothetical protein B4U47_06910 [Helicobacter pylori]ORJ08996.1 hypothetical protein B4917_07715 [Helicobacter pylori]OUJ20849.1 hypothetical protein BZL55_01635 [Helicobacter pylori]